MKRIEHEGYTEFYLNLDDDPTDPHYNELFEAILSSEDELIHFWNSLDSILTRTVNTNQISHARSMQIVDDYIAALRNAFLRIVNDPDIAHENIQAMTDTLICAFLLQTCERFAQKRED